MVPILEAGAIGSTREDTQAVTAIAACNVNPTLVPKAIIATILVAQGPL